MMNESILKLFYRKYKDKFSRLPIRHISAYVYVLFRVLLFDDKPSICLNHQHAKPVINET